MIYILFLTLYLLHHCVYGEKNRFTPTLEVPNEQHNHYLNIINEKFEEGKDQYFFSSVDSGYKCEISNVSLVFQNTSEAIHNLFTRKNENVLKEAIDEFKVKFFITLDRIAPPVSSFKGIDNNPQGYLLEFVSNFRKSFYDLNDDDSLQISQTENNAVNRGHLNHFNGSNYESNEKIEGKNSDLSKETEVENDTNAENNQSSHFSYASQSLLVHNYKNSGSISSSNISSNEPLKKQDALDIILLNTILGLSGACTKLDEKNSSPITFNAVISRNSYSASTNISSKRNLRTEGALDGYINALNARKNANETLKRIFEYINKTFANEYVLSEFLTKFNVTDNSLDQQNILSNEALGLGEDVDKFSSDNIEKLFSEGKSGEEENKKVDDGSN